MLGVGGAMDLVVGARRVIVTISARAFPRRAEGRPPLRLSATAAAAADVVVTELSVFRRVDGRLHLTELLEGQRLPGQAHAAG